MEKLVYIKNVVTLELNQQWCTGCRMCIHVCPRDVFDIENKKAFIKHRDYCIECGACQKNCPERIISVRSGVGCAAGIINGILRGTEPSCDCSSSKNNCC